MKNVLVIAIIGFSLLFAEFDKVGTTAAQFLKIGVGARAMGMGGGFVALADDGSAPFWNPAGMLRNSQQRVALHHNPWVLDIDHNYFSLIHPWTPTRVLGGYATILSMDEQEVNTVQEPDGTGLYYKVQDMAIGGSLALQISDRLITGFGIKYVQLRAYNETADAFAVDLGSIFTTDFYGLRIGMALTNFGGELKHSGRDLIRKTVEESSLDGNYTPDAILETETWPLPLTLRLGAAVDLIGFEPAPLILNNQRLTLAIDAVHPNDGPEYICLGTEYAFSDRYFVRTGYRHNHPQSGWTAGLGLKYAINPGLKLQLDYAILPFEHFDNSSQFALELIFQH